MNPAEIYVEKARLLNKEELEKLLSRVRSDLQMRMDSRKISRLEAAAAQLEIEADQVREWHMKWARPPLRVEVAEDISS